MMRDVPVRGMLYDLITDCHNDHISGEYIFALRIFSVNCKLNDVSLECDRNGSGMFFSCQIFYFVVALNSLIFLSRYQYF